MLAHCPRATMGIKNRYILVYDKNFRVLLSKGDFH